MKMCPNADYAKVITFLVHYLFVASYHFIATVLQSVKNNYAEKKPFCTHHCDEERYAVKRLS